MKPLPILFALAIAIPAAVPAAASAAESAPKASKAKGKTVCTRVKNTGTRLSTKRVCTHTRADDEVVMEGQESLSTTTGLDSSPLTSAAAPK